MKNNLEPKEMTILGWTPPVIYDQLTDSSRVATQADIDDMQQQIHRLGQFFASVRKSFTDVTGDYPSESHWKGFDREHD